MKCLCPLNIQTNYNAAERRPVHTVKRSKMIDGEDTTLVSCGQCIACRINRARMWSLRCAHEAQLYRESCFITLTYSPECLPPDLSVSVRELQLFIKRLRKAIAPVRIRYYAAGEYGSPTDLEVKNKLSAVGRPHYHLLVFGWYPPDCIAIKQGRRGHMYYTSQIVLNAWRNQGFVVIGSVTPASASYVAQYCTKKICGTDADEHYQRIHPETGECLQVKPEFQTCSLGIGRGWLYQYYNDLAKGFVTFDGKKYTIPRYYMKKLNEWCDKENNHELIELLDEIGFARADGSTFEQIPDFKALNYRYDVAKVYRERAQSRAALVTI